MFMLKAQIRQPQTKLNQFRKAGQLPAVVYGRGFESTPILLDYNQFIKEVKEQGKGSLIDLKIDEQKFFKVLLQDSQKDPVRQEFTHIDFYRIRMDEKLTTEIRLNFIGEVPALKAGGILVKSRDYLSVECLPGDLVSEIDVDLSCLKEIHNSIKVSDVAMPAGITVLDEPDLILVGISKQVEEEEEEVSKEQEKEAIEALEKKEGEEKDKGGEVKKEGEEKKEEKDEK
jgi:large subunit ribosomal protein L25